MQIDFKDLDIVEFRNSLKTLREEVELDLKNEPEAAEDIVPLLTAITRLQKDLADMKGPEDLKKRKFLECIPDLTFVMGCLNQFGSDEDFEDEDFDDEDLSFADEDEDEK